MKTAEQIQQYNRTYRLRHSDKCLAKQRAWCAKNREKINAQARFNRALNPERHRTAVRKWQAKNPEKVKEQQTRNRLRNYHKRQYGISREEFEQMLIAQAGMCKICGREFGTPHVDHNHFTGRVRGILCVRCNQGLGHFDDSPETLRNAAKYLEENNP